MYLHSLGSGRDRPLAPRHVKPRMGQGERDDSAAPQGTTQAGPCHVAVPYQLADQPPRQPRMDSWLAWELSIAQGHPENSPHRYFRHHRGQEEVCRDW